MEGDCVWSYICCYSTGKRKYREQGTKEEHGLLAEVPDFDRFATGRFEAFLQKETLLVKNPMIHNSYG